MVIFLCVCAATSGFTRTATGAVFFRRAATRLMRSSSGSLSALKRINPLPEGEFDFALRLAHAGERALAGVAAGRHHPLQLAPADDVESAAQLRQHAQDGLVGVGLNGEADQVLHAGQGPVQVLEMLRQRVLRIDVEGRAESSRERLDGHALAVEPIAGVMKVMHGAGV